LPDARERGALAARGAQLVWGERTYLMGIVNVTPDSFSGDGIDDTRGAVAHAFVQWGAGADLLDVGGESTRPGHQPVDEAAEAARVVPVIAEVREHLPHAPISIDTYKAGIVRAAHAAGADIVNSVWGAPDALLDVVAELAMPLVVMHNQHGTQYDGDVVDAVLAYLDDCATRAVLRGVKAERLLLDPGIGFGKTADQNLAVLRSLDRLCGLGFPTLLGASRKSTIGKLTGREPRDRVFGTVAVTALAVQAGIDVVRVHDVAAAKDAVAVADAIVRDWRPPQWAG
jgi:dihydropteroate synthase